MGEFFFFSASLDLAYCQCECVWDGTKTPIPSGSVDTTTNKMNNVVIWLSCEAREVWVDGGTRQREDGWLYSNVLLVTFGLCMQIYATLPFFFFQGCSLLKATGKFSSVPAAPPTHPQIPHFTHSSTHSNVHEGARLEGNWIKSNPLKLHGARQKKTTGSKRKGICYLTPALHLISWLPGDNQPLGGGLELSSNFSKPPVVVADLVSLHLVHMELFFLSGGGGGGRERNERSRRRRGEKRLRAPPWS